MDQAALDRCAVFGVVVRIVHDLTSQVDRMPVVLLTLTYLFCRSLLSLALSPRAYARFSTRPLQRGTDRKTLQRCYCRSQSGPCYHFE
jgi:hypothetical protein